MTRRGFHKLQTTLPAHPISFAILAFGFGILDTPPAYANPALVTLDTPRFSLTFAADGRPASLKTHPDDHEWLNIADPGPGF